MSEAQRNEHPLDRIVIPRGGYRTVVADPPWKYGKWGKASVAPRGSSYDPQDSVMPYQTLTWCKRPKGTAQGAYAEREAADRYNVVGGETTYEAQPEAGDLPRHHRAAERWAED